MGQQTQLTDSNADTDFVQDSSGPVPDAPAGMVKGGNGARKRILVVDDEMPIRMLLQKILEANGYICRTAENAGHARELLDEKPSDLVLCDINMPGESGLDFIRFVLKAYPDTAAIMSRPSAIRTWRNPCWNWACTTTSSSPWTATAF